MLSESQEKRVWEGMLGSEIRAKYFAELSGIYRKRQQWAPWVTLVFASSDVATFFAAIPPEVRWVRLAVSVCVAAASAYLVLAQNETKAFESSDLFARWSRLQRSYESIWEDTKAEDALPRLRELDEKVEEASRMANHLARNRRSMRKWHHTERQHHLSAVT